MVKAKTEVTLITPHIEALISVLEKEVLSQSKRAHVKQAQENVQGSHFQPLHYLFSTAFPSKVPYAAIRAKADSVWKPGHWLCADPLVFQADLNQVICLGQTMLRWTAEESQKAFELLSALVREDGYELHYGAPDRWYLFSPNPFNIETHTLQSVSGASVTNTLPIGADADYFARLMTESQMLFQETQLVQTLRARGLVAVLGPWFWGEGQLGESIRKLETTLWSEPNFLLTAISEFTQVDLKELPPEPEDWLEALSVAQHTLMLNEEDELRAWVPCVLEALKNKKVASLDIIVSDTSSFRVTREDLLPWWKRIF